MLKVLLSSVKKSVAGSVVAIWWVFAPVAGTAAPITLTVEGIVTSNFLPAEFNGFIDFVDGFSGSITYDPMAPTFSCGGSTGMCLASPLLDVDIDIANSNGTRTFGFDLSQSPDFNTGIIRSDPNFGVVAGWFNGSNSVGPTPAGWVADGYSLFFRGTNDPAGPFSSIQIGISIFSAAQNSSQSIILETNRVVTPDTSQVPLPAGLPLMLFASSVLVILKKRKPSPPAEYC